MIIIHISKLPRCGGFFLCFNMKIMKLTPMVAERIVTAVEHSKLPLYRIAAYCEVTYRTLARWLSNGEDYQKQIESAEIKKGDLTTNQKRELELYLRVEVARSNVESGYLTKIHEIAEKKEDVKAYQWLLKIQDKTYREADTDIEDAAGKQTQQVVVVNLSNKDGEGEKLLSEFMNGSENDAEEEGNSEDTSDSDKL